MSYGVLPLSPQTRTEAMHRQSAIQSPWQASWNDPIDVQDMTFLHSPPAHDSKPEDGTHAHRFNWSLVLGMLLGVAISGSFWTGVGLMIAQVWK